jgi:hypothetical protein
MWLINLFTSVPALVSGMFTTINGITAAIANEKLAQINAKTTEEQINSAERISTLQAQRDLMIAEAATSKLNIIVRSSIALGPALFLLKVFLWDKVIGSFAGCSGHTLPGTCSTFVTDPLDNNLWSVITIVLGFYFLYEGAKLFKR